MTVLISLIVALLFAVIFLFGGSLAWQPGQKGYRRFLSFAGGVSVCYVFVHVLPALSRMQDLTMQSHADFHRMFPEYSVYLWAMAGFLVFYCLEILAAGPEGDQGREVSHGGGAPWKHWVHIGGFSVYAWMLTYIMVWKVHNTIALCLYAVAMGLHILLIVCNLRNHYQTVYDHRGAVVLAMSSLAGWVSGLTVDIPEPILVNLVAVVAGGVIVVTAIAELPKEKEGRFWYFLTGALVFTALLLILSQVEKAGEL